MNVFAAAIFASSPLLKIPNPQIPPQSSGSPLSVGNAIGRTSKPIVSALFFSWDTFQQNAIASVPLQNRLISSPPAIDASKLMPSMLFKSSSALMFSSLLAVYSVCSGFVNVPL